MQPGVQVSFITTGLKAVNTRKDFKQVQSTGLQLFGKSYCILKGYGRMARRQVSSTSVLVPSSERCIT